MTAPEGAIDVGDGARVWYRVDGAGPDVVLVHAGIADLRMWDDVVAELDGRLRTVRLDLRGFGRTTAPAQPFSPSADVDAVMDALGVSRAVVVGASLGGRVALELAVEHPERVGRLVLFDAALPGREPSEELQRFGAEEDAALEEGRIDDAVELNVRLWAPHASPDARERLREMQARAFELQRDPALQLVPVEPPLPDRLGEVRAPAVVAYGEDDVSDFIAIAERLARELPDARLVPIAGAGHVPAVEQPAAAAEIILAAAR